MANIGFIGLGIMGTPMAGHLIKGGHALLPAQPRRRAAGADRRRRHRLRDRARRSRRRPTSSSSMVPDTPDVEAVLFGEDGVAAGLRQGQDRRRHELDLADRDQGVRQEDRRARLRLSRRAGVRRRGRRQGRDADHHGRRPARRRSTRVKPLFELMGKNITLVGGNGDGQTTQGRQPDHRRADHRGGRRGAAVRGEGRRRSGEGAAGADGRLRVVAHPRSARRAHDQAHLRPGLPHRAAPEGPEPRARDRARARRRAAEHRDRAGAVQRLRGATAARRWDHSALVRALEMLANFEIGDSAESTR